jgi:hypothetical protein
VTKKLKQFESPRVQVDVLTVVVLLDVVPPVPVVFVVDEPEEVPPVPLVFVVEEPEDVPPVAVDFVVEEPEDVPPVASGNSLELEVAIAPPVATGVVAVEVAPPVPAGVVEVLVIVEVLEEPAVASLEPPSEELHPRLPTESAASNDVTDTSK